MATLTKPLFSCSWQRCSDRESQSVMGNLFFTCYVCSTK